MEGSSDSDFSESVVGQAVLDSNLSCGDSFIFQSLNVPYSCSTPQSCCIASGFQSGSHENTIQDQSTVKNTLSTVQKVNKPQACEGTSCCLQIDGPTSKQVNGKVPSSRKFIHQLFLDIAHPYKKKNDSSNNYFSGSGIGKTIKDIENSQSSCKSTIVEEASTDDNDVDDSLLDTTFDDEDDCFGLDADPGLLDSPTWEDKILLPTASCLNNSDVAAKSKPGAADVTASIVNKTGGRDENAVKQCAVAKSDASPSDGENHAVALKVVKVNSETTTTDNSNKWSAKNQKNNFTPRSVSLANYLRKCGDDQKQTYPAWLEYARSHCSPTQLDEYMKSLYECSESISHYLTDLSTNNYHNTIVFDDNLKQNTSNTNKSDFYDTPCNKTVKRFLGLKQLKRQ